MCADEKISEQAGKLADAKPAADTPTTAADVTALPPIADWYSDPEVLRRFGTVIAQAVWRPFGLKS
jgi:hypothetical protein